MRRVLLSLLGIALILWAVVPLVLGIVGERAPGTITHVRREGGERPEAVAGRYTYAIGYTFKLPDGTNIDGFTKKVSNGAFVKNPSTPVAVRYLKQLPLINVLESETEPSFGNLLLVAIGGFLLWLVNGDRSKERAK